MTTVIIKITRIKINMIATTAPETPPISVTLKGSAGSVKNQ